MANADSTYSTFPQVFAAFESILGALMIALLSFFLIHSYLPRVSLEYGAMWLRLLSLVSSLASSSVRMLHVRKVYKAISPHY